MINLLSPSAKKHVVHEYWARVISVWMIIFGTAGLACAALLLPTYVLIGLQIAPLEATLQQVNDDAQSYDLSAAALTTANNRARQLVQPEPRTFTTYFDLLQQQGGASIALQEVRLTRGGENPGRIQVAGEAQTRQALVDFRDTIREHEYFAGAQLPISSLVQDQNVPFSIQIELASSTRNYDT